MGQPAARQGDMSAHGGTIAAGDPTVLINGQPAARQGDMHMCPMMNPGPSPHVGGPIAMGSATVLINGQPAARMGDMCVCAGPPDSVAMGEPTVLIGSGGNPVMIGGKGIVKIGGSGPVIIGGGGSGGGGGGGGGGNGQGAVAAAASAQHRSPESTELVEHWLQFVFEDEAGGRVSGVPYELEEPSGETSEYWLEGDGEVRRSRQPEGDGTATVRKLSGAEWSKTEAEVGEEVTVTAQAKGFEGGTPATVQIKEVPAEVGGSSAIVKEVETEVSGEEVEASWTYTHENVQTAQGGDAQQLPAYIAEVRVEGHPLPSTTGRLTYEDKIKVEVVDEEENPRKKEGYHLSLSNGELRSGSLDRSGKAKEMTLPPSPCRVSLDG